VLRNYTGSCHTRLIEGLSARIILAKKKKIKEEEEHAILLL